MKYILMLFVLALALAADEPAKKKSPPKQSVPEKYAAELANLLTEYQKQVSLKIDAEQRAYLAAARFYDAAFRVNILESLTEDRISETRDAQAALQRGDLTPDRLLEGVRMYAQGDFDKTRSLYQLSLDSYTSYLANLNNLDIEAQAISALARDLNDLATPASLKARLGEIQAYQQSFNQQMHLSGCTNADSVLTIKTGQKAAVDAQIQKLTASASTIPAALTARSTELQTDIGALQMQRANSGGFTAATGKCEAK